MKSQKELIIGKKAKKTLNKQQQIFNRLVKKLEKLRLAKESVTKILNEKLDFYGKHIHPLEEKVAELHKQSAKTFYRLYHEQPTLSKSDKEVLIDITDSQMAQFMKFSRDGLDEELKEIYEFIAKENYDESVESDFQAMKDDMKQTFEGLGIDIDLEDFTRDLSEEEMMRKMFEMLNEVKEQAENKAAEEPKRKKTKKTNRKRRARKTNRRCQK